MTDILLREDKDGLCTLTLNRPEKLNALNTDLFRRIDEECAKLEQQAETVGCVVLKANGRMFCAGADLETGATGAGPRFKPGVVERLSHLPQIVIAQIHATCVTGGLELALAADIIVAAQSARFADTHGKWGFVGGWGMVQRLPRRIGMGQAKLMMTTARFVDATDAHRIGLVDILVPDDALDDQVAALACDVLANSWFTNRETKRLMASTEGMRLGDGLAYEHYHHPGFAPDSAERIAAFNSRKR